MIPATSPRTVRDDATTTIDPDRSIFLDTSAILPFLDADSADHVRVRATFERLGGIVEHLVVHQYVIVETNALVQRRLGLDVARRFSEDIVPALDVVWIDADRHRAGVDRWLSGPSSVSFVDAVSFEVMRDRGIDRAFALDADFATAGFALISLTD